MAVAATTYCGTDNAFHQNSIDSKRSQFTSFVCRTNLSPLSSFSAATSLSHLEQQTLIKTIKSDQNNNDQRIDNAMLLNTDGVLYITSDDDDDEDTDGNTDDDSNDQNRLFDVKEEERILSFVGLRPKSKTSVMANSIVRPLTKRFACPVCLLPLPKHSERVRQALYIRLPFLKFLTITYDYEKYCATDDNDKIQSILPRSGNQLRGASKAKLNNKKSKSPNKNFIKMAARAFRKTKDKVSLSQHVKSALQCHVRLDRLEQSTIDQFMQNVETTEDPGASSPPKKNQSKSKHSKVRRQSSTTTCKTKPVTTSTQTALKPVNTNENTFKRKSSTTNIMPSKRFKSTSNDYRCMNDDHTDSNSLPEMYKRIYLKCFVCSKRQCIDSQATNSNVLHSHWLEHGKNLSLNIYDSEINSILTRVVEFFNKPKRHILEGTIKTVFILDSKEIRSIPPMDTCSKDSYIVID